MLTRATSHVHGRFLAIVWRSLSDLSRPHLNIPLTKGGAAFENDLRGTSGIGTGDGITNHTEKWLQVLKIVLSRNSFVSGG